MQQGQNYQRMIARLKEWGAIEVNRSVWLVRGNQNTSATAIRDDLVLRIDANDRLFVATLAGETAWIRLMVPHETLKKYITGV